MKTIIAAIIIAAAILSRATPAEDRDWSTRVSCELQTAGAQSLPLLTFQQGATPLLSLDQYRSGRAVDAATNGTVEAVFTFGPSATNQYFVAVTNYAAVSNGYLVQLPTIGTNTANSAWWYTAYFRRSGSLYWTGNGRLNILATTSTADGLNWQRIVSGGTVDTTARTVASNAQDTATAAGSTADASYIAATNAAALASVGSLHAATTNNPHGTTAAMIGAVTAAQVATSTVSRARAAEMVLSANGMTWTDIINGKMYLFEVTNSTSVYVVSTSGEGYNGPAAGTVWSDRDVGTDIDYDTSGDYTLKCNSWSTESAFWECEKPPTYQRFVVEEAGYELPKNLIASADAIGSLVIDWLQITNVYEVSTAAPTLVIIRGEVAGHNADTNTTAHAGLFGGKADIATVMNVVNAATAGMLTEEVDGVAKPIAEEALDLATNALALTTDARLKLHHYGDANITVSPDDWFGFDPATGTITSFDYEAGREHVVIPWEIGGVPVVEIGGYAFSDIDTLNGDPIASVVGPKSVTSVAFASFSSCNNLISVSFPSATSVAFASFNSCINLTSVSFPLATSVDVGAFSSCVNLTSVSFPLATSVGGYAFEGCGSLESVFFGKNAPTATLDVFNGVPANQVTVYRLNGTTGWGATWGGMPVVAVDKWEVENADDVIGIVEPMLEPYATTGAVAASIANSGHLPASATNGWEVGSHVGLATTGEVAAVESGLLDPWIDWSADIVPANGTAVVTRATGAQPRLVLSGATVLSVPTAGWPTTGVARVSLSLWAGSNSVLLLTDTVIYAETPDIATNDWTTLMFRRVGNQVKWEGIGL